MKPLVIFDCDGVLVDTETIANREMARWITDAGFPIPYEECRARFVGKSMNSVRKDLLEAENFDLGDDFVTRWQSSISEIFAKGVDAVAGVHDAIDQLRAAEYSLCVASSGRIDKMHFTLGSAGLLDDLKDVLFSSTMVKKGKPAPDLFLFAAKQMGFEPANCIVIEDSGYGAMAAKAAGMKCLGYKGDPLTNQSFLERENAILFDEMSELPKLIVKHSTS
ncbi:MAG: HAD-IA family hydrolase [Pseudomonadota bacterium]